MMESNYINYVHNGDLIYHSISSLPLIIWIYIIYNYIGLSSPLSSAINYQKERLIEMGAITKKNTFSNISTNYFFLFLRTSYLLFWILFPFMMYFFNLFRAENISFLINNPDKNNDSYITVKEFFTWLALPMKLKKSDLGRRAGTSFNDAALPPGMNACMDTSSITEEQKESGILAWFDWKCRATQTNIIQTYVSSLVNSFYYINYCLFLIVLLTFTHQTKKEATDWRRNATLIDWIFISLFFGTIGTTLTVFDSYSWWSMIFVDLSTVLLSMNLSSFAILIMAIVNAIYFTPHNFSLNIF